MSKGVYRSKKSRKATPRKPNPIPKKQSEGDLDERLDQFLERFEPKSLPHYGKQHFLLEHYILKQRKDILKKIEGMTEPDRKSLALSMQLSNLFLKKYHLDPGFHLEINLQMDEKPELMRQIQREIFAFLIDQQSLPPVSELTKEMEEEFKLYKANKLIERSIHPWTSNLFFSTGLIRDDLKERHFYQMWKKCEELGTRIDTLATESLLLELMMGEYYGHVLFQDLTLQRNPGNTQYYFLESTREIVEKLDFSALDYLESQRKNLLHFDDVPKIIDSLKYPNLTQILKELLPHTKDVVQDQDPITQVQLKTELTQVLAVLFFEKMESNKQFALLNRFDGLESVFTHLKDNLSLYPLENIIPDFPIWESLNLLPEIQAIIENHLPQDLKQTTPTDKKLLLKYKCRAYIARSLINEALNSLKSEFAEIEEWINAPSSLKKPDDSDWFHLELLNLLGEIYCTLGDEQKIDALVELYRNLINKSADDRVKLKLNVQLAILHRRERNFAREMLLLEDLQPIIEFFRSGKQMNPVEVTLSLFPLGITASENNDPNRIIAHQMKFSTPEFLKLEPTIPKMFETYCLYADLRWKYIKSVPNIVDLERMEHHLHFERIRDNCLAYQSMATFKKAIEEIQTVRQDLLIAPLDQEEVSIYIESCTFPNLYLGDFRSTIDHLQRAIKNNPLDFYFYSYLFILYAITGNLGAVKEILLKLYSYERSAIPNFYWYLKKCFQNVMIWAKSQKFASIIIPLIKEIGRDLKDENRIAKVCCDVGIAIADLGYSEEAIQYFNQALQHTDEIKFKAQIVNNIGSVYSDQQLLEKALDSFEEGRKLDPTNLTTWMNIAKIHTFQVNYHRAKKILEEARKQFENHADAKMAIDIELAAAELGEKSNINLSLVKDPTVLSHIRYALHLIQNLNFIPGAKDYTGPIFTALANAFTCLFELKLGSIFLQDISKKYGKGASIPKEDWKQIPWGLQEMWKGKSIGVGQLARLIQDIQEEHPNPMVKELAQQIPSSLIEEDLTAIENLGSKLEPLRNPASHGKILDWNTFTKNIGDVTVLLNQVIEIFSRF